MKILVLIQARIKSSRLPFKSLIKLDGKPLIQHTIERASAAKYVDKVILATSKDKSNDPLQELCEKIGVECYRGSEEDVLGRFLEAAAPHNPELVVRICGDEPLLDPQILEKAIKMHSGFDYSTTVGKVPNGLDVEVLTYDFLKKLGLLVKERDQTEYMSRYILENAKNFKVQYLDFGEKIARPDIKVTVDTKEDLDFVSEIYETLDGDVTAEKIVDVVDKKMVSRKQVVLLRADGSNKKGMGDIVTLLNIASNLEDFSFRFACVENKKVEDFITKQGIEVLSLRKKNNTDEIKKYCRRNNIKHCIVEIFPCDSSYVEKLSEFLELMSVVFFDEENFSSDIVLCWELGAENFSFKNVGTKLLGPRYAPIKPDFGQYVKKTQSEKIKKITISFGGADTQNLTKEILEILNEKNFDITVIVGPAFKNHDYKNVKIIKSPNNIYKLFSDSDLVICSGGFTTFELSALNVPFIGISSIPWEQERLKLMESLGTGFFVAPEQIKENLLKVVNKLSGLEIREKTVALANKLVDGNGGGRIAKFIREKWK